MTFQVPSFEQIRDRYLQELVNQRPEASIGVDSDNYVRGTAAAAVLEALYAHQAWVFRQAFPDLADADFMEKMANQRGLQRKAAIAAAGTVQFTGAEGTNVPQGQLVFTAQGVYASTTESVLIGVDGTAVVEAVASVPGAGGNLAANTPATVSSPPANIAANALILEMGGGTDNEDDAGLLARLLLLLSDEAQGGNAVDYERWALEVSGITRVYVFDVRRGAGTVDIVPLTDAGLPSTIQLDAVQAIIDERRPVGMRSRFGAMALAPTAVLADVTADVTLAGSYTLLATQDQLEAAIDEVFRGLGPGETLVRSKLINAIMNVPGVVDVTLAAPAANVPCTVDEDQLELIVRGALTLS